MLEHLQLVGITLLSAWAGKAGCQPWQSFQIPSHANLQFVMELHFHLEISLSFGDDCVFK